MTLQDLQAAFGSYKELLVIAKSLHKLDENACNYGLTPRQEKAEKRLEEKAESIASLLNFSVFHQGDPRGCSLYLVKRGFNWNKDQYTDGIAII